ncbi:MAG TPA: hypothetical protein PKZ32_21715, partial [Candidatus Melainabacteria bacterium]|nr:hypothetical protein [Candidatus Melainabacteria bacterium]
PSKKALKSWGQAGRRGKIILEKSIFPEHSGYQLRIFAQSADQRVISVSSDLIDLGINDRPRGQEL